MQRPQHGQRPRVFRPKEQPQRVAAARDQQRDKQGAQREPGRRMHADAATRASRSRFGRIAAGAVLPGICRHRRESPRGHVRFRCASPRAVTDLVRCESR
jgi:hypothetical protein